MIVGIDLGTSNSLVALWRDGEAQIIPNALGEALTPSVVGLDDAGEILVGASARERLLTHPELTAATFKRYMGSDRITRLGKREFRPEELSALVLRSLKDDAEAYLGESVEEAVITVPAYFNDAQRKATRNAGKIAGLRVERLLNEPTAAALAYGLHQRDTERQFLVFDLGGGTFDVSLLELFDGIMEVRASAGDNYLGGEDFVDLLVAAFMRQVGTPAGLSLESPKRLLSSFLGSQQDAKHLQLQRVLREQAERAKRRLSQADQATMTIQHGGESLSWTVTNDDFAELSEPLLERVFAPVQRALRDARIPARDLDEIVLVGGATRMPIIRKLVARLFGRLPAGHIDPDQVVALGAAIQAGLKARDAALDDVVVTDVSPYTLGIAIAKRLTQNHHEDGYYEPIIERNTVIPASRIQTFYTIYDHQREVVIRVYQGESSRVAGNIQLGEVRVQVPPRQAGEEAVDVRFTYDINGLLEVEVKVQSTGLTRRAVIEESPGSMSSDEIEARLAALAALKIHPRDQAANRALLARAERLYEELLGDARAYVGEQLTLFRATLDRQDPEEIEEVRNALAEQLQHLESDPYL